MLTPPPLQTWSNPALVRRFEELAGFRLLGVNGQLALGGIPSRTFDFVATSVPGLEQSAIGGRAEPERVFKVAGKLVGDGGKGRATTATAATAEAKGQSHASAAASATTNGLGQQAGEATGTGLNGLGRVPRRPALDDRPSLAFAPRFEAARFLVDLLLLSSNREDPQVCMHVGVWCVSRKARHESAFRYGGYRMYVRVSARASWM